MSANGFKIPPQSFSFQLQPGGATRDVSMVAQVAVPANTYSASQFLAALPEAVRSFVPPELRPQPDVAQVTVRAPRPTTLTVALGPVGEGIPALQGAQASGLRRLIAGFAAQVGALCGTLLAWARKIMCLSPKPQADATMPPAYDAGMRVQGASITLSAPLEGRLSSLPAWLGHQRVTAAQVDAQGHVSFTGGLRLFNFVPLPGLQSTFWPKSLRLPPTELDMRVPEYLGQAQSQANGLALRVPGDVTGLSTAVLLGAPCGTVRMRPDRVRAHVQQDVAVGGSDPEHTLRFVFDGMVAGNLSEPEASLHNLDSSAKLAVAQMQDDGAAVHLAELVVSAKGAPKHRELRLTYTTTPAGSQALKEHVVRAFGGEHATPTQIRMAEIVGMVPSFTVPIKSYASAAEVTGRLPSAAERFAALDAAHAESQRPSAAVLPKPEARKVTLADFRPANKTAQRPRTSSAASSEYSAGSQTPALTDDGASSTGPSTPGAQTPPMLEPPSPILIATDK